MEESSAWAREEAGVPVWLQFEDLAAHASVRYEAAVLRLDERHVASQQRRLLAFVSSALGDKDMLAFRSLRLSAGAASADKEELARAAEDKERLLFHLSVLRMLRLMAANGMYPPDYILTLALALTLTLTLPLTLTLTLALTLALALALALTRHVPARLHPRTARAFRGQGRG